MLNRSITAKEFVEAAKNGNLYIVNRYLDLHQNDKAAIDVCIDLQTALRNAAANGHTAIVNALINAKADVNLCNTLDVSPLYFACLGGYIDTVHTLLKVPCININAKTKFNTYPLEAALNDYHIEIVKLLLAAGVKIPNYNMVIARLYNRTNDKTKELIEIIKIHHRREMRQEFLNSIKENSNDALSDTTTKSILELPEHKFERLEIKVRNLQSMGLLTNETLMLALRRVTIKIPAIPKSELTKGEKRADGRREHKLDRGTTFFLKAGASKHKDDEGGQSTINKGYSAPNATDPSYTVKRFCRPEQSYTISSEYQAKRECKYSKYFFKRESNWYQSKHGPVAVMEWQQVDSLKKMLDANVDFSKYTRVSKLKMLLSLAICLDTIHKDDCIFADLKPDNCVSDKDTLKLIDFGSTQKIDSTKTFSKTLGYFDEIEGSPKKHASDMFAFGYIVSALHPELFIDDLKKAIGRIMPNGEIYIHTKAKHNVEKRKDVNFTETDKAILALLDAAMERKQEDRCTSQQVVKFCKLLIQMLANKDEIDSNELHTLLSTTINRNVFEVEDALRSCKRPAKFGAVPQKQDTSTTLTDGLYAQTKKEKPEPEETNKQSLLSPSPSFHK